MHYRTLYDFLNRVPSPRRLRRWAWRQHVKHNPPKPWRFVDVVSPETMKKFSDALVENILQPNSVFDTFNTQTEKQMEKFYAPDGSPRLDTMKINPPGEPVRVVHRDAKGNTFEVTVRQLASVAERETYRGRTAEQWYDRVLQLEEAVSRKVREISTEQLERRKQDVAIAELGRKLADLTRMHANQRTTIERYHERFGKVREAIDGAGESAPK